MVLQAMGDGEVRIGTSGYAYDHWRGVLYPSGLPRDRWLARYAECFDTVELNGTFYGLPAQDAVRRWRQQVPARFLFAAKMSRYGTHLKRLREPAGWLDRFLEAMEPLGSQLGPILIQLPPRWRRDVGRLLDLLAALPRGRRFTMEFRDPDWFHESVSDALRAHDVALCIHDLVEDHPDVATAGWVYFRFHGPSRAHPYTGRYPTRSLAGAARDIRDHLRAGRDVYAYFDNDVAGAAVKDALRLREQLMPDGSGRVADLGPDARSVLHAHRDPSRCPSPVREGAIERRS
jgi:uncharacterized protein YecE (DUF72 family)